MQYQVAAINGEIRTLILCPQNTHDQKVLVRRAHSRIDQRPLEEIRKRAWSGYLYIRRTGRGSTLNLNARSIHQVGRSVRKRRWPLLFLKKPRTKTYGVFAHRNPVPIPRADGKWVSRSEDRRSLGPLPQEPPRITLDSPLSGPVGFFDGLDL